MDVNLVKVDVLAKDKDDAVRKTGEVLYKNGYVAKEYIEAMVRVVNEYGPYIVIAKNIAIPHARPEEGAIKSGFCIVRLKKSIKFGNEENDSVKLLIGLSAVDSDAHLKNIQQVVSVLDNEDHMNVLMNGSEEEIINILGGEN